MGFSGSLGASVGGWVGGGVGGREGALTIFDICMMNVVRVVDS